MRTISRTLCLFALVALGATQASARELDSRGEGNTSISPAPMGSTSRSMRQVNPGQMKKEGAVPAKYDVSYPVRDVARMDRARQSI